METIDLFTDPTTHFRFIRKDSETLHIVVGAPQRDVITTLEQEYATGPKADVLAILPGSQLPAELVSDDLPEWLRCFDGDKVPGTDTIGQLVQLGIIRARRSTTMDDIRPDLAAHDLLPLFYSGYKRITVTYGWDAGYATSADTGTKPLQPVMTVPINMVG